jgi:prepilin-type N-terminal cleavage/methylation domain-containing protein
MKNNKGFTLIELLVVIAIIGILSAVVLASLNSARNKGADAAVKANLANIRAQAEIVYDNATPGSYAAVCDDANVKAAVSAAESAGGAGSGCDDTDDAWAADADLKNGGFWCVDSTGAAHEIASTKGATATVCPAS